MADILGRAPHGARGLKYQRQGSGRRRPRRAPHGARGLKFIGSKIPAVRLRSRPAWGAWIEMLSPFSYLCSCLGRAPHGARGLK